MMFQITIPGECRVKKNSMHEKWFRYRLKQGCYLKTGEKVLDKDKDRDYRFVKEALNKPIRFYTKQYREWAKGAMQAMTIWKSSQIIHNTNMVFPIESPVMVWYVFFMKFRGRIDLSNLVDGVDDMLAGNIGVTSKKVKKEAYQILKDDSADIIKNSNQSFFIDNLNPRLDIFITDFSLKKYSEAFRILYPGMSLSTGLEESPQINIDFDNLFNNG